MYTKKKCEEQEKNVEATLETTERKKSEESIYKVELGKEREILNCKKQAQEELAKRYDQLAREAMEERKKYEEKEDRAIRRSTKSSGLLGIFTEGITTSYFPSIGNAFSQSRERLVQRAGMYREKVKQKLEIELEMLKTHHEALAKLTDFAFKIQNVGKEEEMADVVIEALHETSGALRHLSVIMMEASNFWACIRDHCKRLDDHLLNSLVEKYTLKDEGTKKKFWRSPQFKADAVEYRAKWVALHDICNQCSQQLEIVRCDLYKYIEDCPTYEESRERLSHLATQFSKSLEDAKKLNDIEEQKKSKELKNLEKKNEEVMETEQ